MLLLNALLAGVAIAAEPVMDPQVMVQATVKTNHAIALCTAVESYFDRNMEAQYRRGTQTYVEQAAYEYLRFHLKREPAPNEFPPSAVTVEKPPKHGTLYVRPAGGLGESAAWRYTPNLDFEKGIDSATFLVRGKDIALRVVVVFRVEPPMGDLAWTRVCPRDGWEVISDASNEGANNLTTWQTQSSLSALLATASGVHTELTDLPGAALGLHEGGTGWNARITLDSNAAGHGWYVDATPWSPSSALNDDFLPTGSPPCAAPTASS